VIHLPPLLLPEALQEKAARLVAARGLFAVKQDDTAQKNYWKKFIDNGV